MALQLQLTPGPRPLSRRSGAPAVTFGTLPPAWTKALVVFAIVGGALLFNDLYVFESVVIPSSSMEPTILPNERLVLSRFPHTIRRFDVVVIESPRLGVRIAKRVIGLPGERVRLEDSWRVFLNDTALTYSDEAANHVRMEAGHHLIEVMRGVREPFETQFGGTDVQLGPDEYYVLGDNRLASDDSRAIGPVRRREIQGTLGRVWYSYDVARNRVRSERLLRQVH